MLLETIPLGRTVEIYVDREGYRYRLTSKVEYADEKNIFFIYLLTLTLWYAL